MIPRTTEQRIIAAAVLIAIAGYLVLWLCIKPSVFARSRSDFGTFYRAGTMVLSGDGARVYDLSAEHQYDAALGTRSVDAEGNSVSLPFVFAPFALAFCAPLALLPYEQAEAVWYAINAAMLLALPLLLRKRRLIGPRTSAIALIVPLLFLPVILALLQGQPSILLLLLFAMGYVDLADGKETRAGCWFALASFKPQFVVPLLLALLIWRKRRALRSFALTCGGLTLASLAIVGWRATLSYPLALMQYANMGSRLGAEHPASMPNLRGFLYVLLHAHLPPSIRQKVTIAISLLLLAATARLLKRYRRVSPATFSVLVLVTLMTSYHAYLHDDSLLLLPVLLLGNTLPRSRVNALPLLISATIAALLVVPLAPTSLTTTAVEVFLAIAVLAGLLVFQICNGNATANVEGVTEVSEIPVQLRMDLR
jgi:hypothetical protein